MPTFIDEPVRVEAAGEPPKIIEEYVGRVRTAELDVGRAASVARMRSPAGWSEPGQRPEFTEITVVLAGLLRVEWCRADGEEGVLDVEAGQAIVIHPGEWVRYSTPGEEGAEYVAVCLPAFSPETVHRDADE